VRKKAAIRDSCSITPTPINRGVLKRYLNEAGVNLASSVGAAVNYSKPAANDAVDGNNVAVNCEQPSGSTFPLGTTQVNCSATDAPGNKAEDGFKVIVTYA
jgi:hypothetical protein